MSRGERRPRFTSPAWWPAGGLLLLLVINGLFDPGFLKLTLLDGHLFGTPVDITNQGARVMLLSLGMTLVIATGGVDLSVGSVMAISAALCGLLLGHGVPLAVVVPVAILAGVVTGMINGVLVARVGVQPIVATLILMVAGRGVAQVITGGQMLIIKSEGFAYFGNGFLLALPFAPLLVGALYLGSHAMLRKSALGLFVEAVGDNPTASRFAGLAAARIKILAYVFCGACAGLAGVLAAAQVQVADAYSTGENMELDAIFAVVVGGTALTGGRFYLLGSLVGALLLQTLTLSMYNLGVPPAIAPVPKALLIVAVALFQSERVRRWIALRFTLGKAGASS